MSPSLKNTEKRSFTINNAYHIDGCPTKFSNKDYTAIIAKYQKQKSDYAKKTEAFLTFIKRIDDEEKSEIKKYKGLFSQFFIFIT